MAAANRNQKIKLGMYMVHVLVPRMHACIGFLFGKSVRLMCKRVTLNAGLHVRLLSVFRSSLARYPINRIVMHRYAQDRGRRSSRRKK